MAAAETLKERGAYKIFVMATHGILSSDAPRLIEESAIDEVCVCLCVWQCVCVCVCVAVCVCVFYLRDSPWDCITCVLSRWC